jgi:hypothetical protein
LAEERDSLKKEMARLRTTLTLLQEKKLRQADKKIEFHEQIKFSDEEVVAQTEALLREEARKDRIEKAIKDTIENIEIKSEEMRLMERQMEDASSKIEELERTLRDQRVIFIQNQTNYYIFKKLCLKKKVVNEVAMRETETAVSKQDKLKSEVDSQIALVERLASDAFKRQQELKVIFFLLCKF